MTINMNRDAYGFSVRPQHVQRYREYANIYKVLSVMITGLLFNVLLIGEEVCEKKRERTEERRRFN